MVNVLRPDDNDLVKTDYSDLLNKILKVLRSEQTENPFRLASDRKQLVMDIDSIATQVAALSVHNPLGGSAHYARSATVNFTPGFSDNFPDQVWKIRTRLQELLESVLLELPDNRSIDQFVSNLVTSLTDFQGKTPKLDFTYPFGNYPGLRKQRLSVNKTADHSRDLLKFHKITITVLNSAEFNSELRNGLINYINTEFAGVSESDREELYDIVDDLEKDPKSDFYRLKHIADTETLGQLKKQAQIHYLEILKRAINTSASPGNAKAAIYLEDLIRRLKLINHYINDINKADGEYLVNYAEVSVNYRDVFSRADAFNRLPIIPIIEGYLGESTDEGWGELQFIFGLKLKLDGKVHAHGSKRVFEYSLNLINPDSQEHQELLKDVSKREAFARKVLTIVFLYYFVFAGNDPSDPGYTPTSDLKYDPINAFEEKVLPRLRESKDSEKQDMFRGIIKGFDKYNVQSKIDQLKDCLTNTIKYKTRLSSPGYPLHISVKKGILENDISNIQTRQTLFKEVLGGNPKNVLKYLSIREANAGGDSVCSLEANIRISDIRYCAEDEQQSFSMEYDDITGIKALPILLVPRDNRATDIYNQCFKQHKLMLFPYKIDKNNPLDSQGAFVYRFTFALLAYICLRLLLQEQKRLFIPILRLHLSNKEDEAPIEKFLLSLCMVLSHLLNQKHRSNTQGIDIRDLSSYKIPNVMTSLYSVLPKRFRFNQPLHYPQGYQPLEKLAIIVVSSRESDSKWGSRHKRSNLMGEVVGVIRRNDGAVRLQLLTTFSGNYDHQRLFQEPTVVIDQVTKLYDKNGYKHFIYVAKAPYTSTLHMTQSQDDDGLFFMSKDVIRALKGEHKDIKIYPIFFDKYYVVKLKKIGASSLYIQDTEKLTKLMAEESKQSVVFFNLFNGIEVPGEQRNYNGVISYATLLNIYEGILDDQDIRNGLMYDTPLKQDIVQYLSLFHFWRYQKAREISFKLDPYENLIGDYSVGALSLFNHMRGQGNFNCLAFLTEVRNILNSGRVC
ncbi:hypothetical protein BJP36_22505 [Moorena producens JHB]|uniref:Uncharacterized protein n=2 Tax=Moorena TaxID=1155738 RepID=A0A1D9G3S7_MOOP1|nr:hypothetical protein [Moorena producens]AOY82263.1 hypothetical protein BJP36_22505 [Moorena producens JHB]